MRCDRCVEKLCEDGRDCTDISEAVKALYNSEVLRSMKVSGALEVDFYMKKTRIEELILYAKEMEYKTLGLAFCIGLGEEAKIVCEILSRFFTVHSVCCKVCGIDKASFDLKYVHTEREREAICNPLGQAQILNEQETDLNIILGLCIGHDILFTRYSKAPVTTLAVKDRMLAHNPLGAIYSGYYKNKLSIR
ncbi:MAG: DUF1847 domain-containing protein [Halobacteriota archaeon]|nr:DUF1847 domain-containing protein [Halobacteriota archaeon]